MLKKYEHMMREANLIGGQWVQADSGATFDVTNPATGAVIGTVPRSGAAETRRAIEAAEAAFQSWRKVSVSERHKLLRRLHDVMMDNLQSLGEMLTIEQGKSLAEAKAEINLGAAYVLWFAEECRRAYGDVIPSPWNERRILTLREPVGVVGAITPWNFPSSMLARKLAPALAAGCTAVVKPASQTPFSALAWGVLLEEAGFPNGVVNIVTGSAVEIGDELCGSPLVRKVTFTGSTEVGRMVLSKCASSVKKVSLELGGNAPFIVFDDADLDRAISGAMLAKYRNSGQTCVCTNRFFVQSKIYDTFVNRLAEESAKLKVGAGLDEGTQQGPLIDGNAVEKVEEFVSDAKAKGGRILAGGKRHPLGGTYFEPTVIADATPDMRFMKEEIFGPVAPVFRFETEEEVLALANDTEFGLAGYFYTRDLSRAFRMMEALKYGMVGVNEGLITTPEAPFGGVKQSGLGKEGGYEGIADYFDTKYVCVGGLNR
jgi:succinate-semialdehyde dehydrogenase / glutarate-semialdehyde dehydrogenase